MMPKVLERMDKKSRSEKRLVPLGAPRGTRTPDLMIKSHMLYQLSYGCGVKINKKGFSTKLVKENDEKIL